MGRFPNAKAVYDYRHLNCLYCLKYGHCQVIQMHEQASGDEQAQVDLDKIIPWDGEKNGRCDWFEEVE